MTSPSGTDRGWTVMETARAVSGGHVLGDGSVRVRAIVLDSRQATAGSLFLAMLGTRADGRQFAADAMQRGSVAVLATRPVEALDVPQIIVPDVRRALAEIALAWYGAPERDMVLIGVTGTNGKTTTVELVATMSRAAGHAGATLGTLGATVDGEEVPFPVTRPTTPEAHELRQMLALVHERGATLVAMEVSSHALVLDRAWGLRFDGAVFTNLTEDHLDFHGTLEDYFRAKARLFEGLGRNAVAAINVGDPYGRRLVDMTRARTITYGWSAAADVRPREAVNVPSIRGTVETPAGLVELAMPLVGRFNVENALAAVAIGIGLGMEPDQIAAGLAAASPVPGRLEPVSIGQDFTVVVDYAHTPDALENVLGAAREMTRGRVICLVGCGGDRDPFKRPVMGGIATRTAEMTIFTSDNPRTEDPDRILDQIIAGATGGNPYERIEPRRQAIRRAIALAETGDVIVLAGKGHEPYQEVDGVKHPFDDRVEARRALEERVAEVPTKSGSPA